MLSTLKNRTGPYSLPLRVVVVSVKEPYTYAEDKQLINFSIADTSGYCKAVCFDQTKFSNITENNGLVLKNIILKHNEVVVTKQSKIYKTTAQTIQNEILRQARQLIFPQDSEIVPISEAKKSPKKTMTSVRGKIINEGLKMNVNVKNKACEVKTITVQDDSDEIKVSLWREIANSDIHLGDFVEVTNVVTNQYHEEINLSTTQHSAIKKIEIPEEEVIIELLGVEVGTHETEIITENQGEFIVDNDIFPVIDHFPITLRVRARGKKIIQICNL